MLRQPSVMMQGTVQMPSGAALVFTPGGTSLCVVRAQRVSHSPHPSLCLCVDKIGLGFACKTAANTQGKIMKFSSWGTVFQSHSLSGSWLSIGEHREAGEKPRTSMEPPLPVTGACQLFCFPCDTSYFSPSFPPTFFPKCLLVVHLNGFRPRYPCPTL